MEIEFIKASEDCFKQVTGNCYHYPTIWAFIFPLALIGLITLIYWIIKIRRMQSKETFP